MCTKFRRDTSIHGWDITTSGSWKETIIILEFYFRFRFLTLHHYPHVILYPSTKLHPNRTIRNDVMTSYPFLKMAPTALQFYFRLRFGDVAHLEMSKSICRPNFGEISQSVTETLLLPVSRNTVVILAFYFRFPFSPLHRHDRHVILYLPNRLHPHLAIRGGVTTS